MKPIRILTNFEHLPKNWISEPFRGTTTVAKGPRQFLGNLFGADLILVNGDVRSILSLALAFSICPFLKKPLVAVDLVLRKPTGALGPISAFIKKSLFARVDYFLNYFKDLRGYTQYYGIGPDRSAFVHFKANLYERLTERPQPDGDYVLCFGRSLRDYDTFFEAVDKLNYPSAIPIPNFSRLKAHGARFSRKPTQLPQRLTLLEDDGTPQSQARIFQKARIVVIPILSTSLCASGIGTYLNAMLMGKCVILSDGPGASDVLSGQAIIVPPENPRALTEAIRQAWEDKELREKVSQAGQRFAESLGGEQALMQRIIDAVVPKFFGDEKKSSQTQ